MGCRSSRRRFSLQHRGDVSGLTELEAQADDGQRDPPGQQQQQEAVSTQHLVKSSDGVLSHETSWPPGEDTERPAISQGNGVGYPGEGWITGNTQQ